MRDLDLWHRLTTGPDHASAADLAAQLRALADQPAYVRVALAGAVRRLVDHAEPAVRAAAVRALAGVTGVDGLRAIAGALGDESPEVAAAAIAALIESARHVPSRIVHAVFHPSLAVRRAVAAADLPHDAAPLVAYLRGDPDPELRELARRAPWPRESLALALHLYARGRADAHELLDIVFDADHGAVAALLARELARSPAQCGFHLERMRDVEALELAPGRDVIDGIVDACACAPTQDERVLDRLVEIVLNGRDPALQRRLSTSLLSAAAGRPIRPAEVAACVALDPGIIASRWFRRDMAAAAAAGIRRHRQRVRASAKRIGGLLDHPVIRTEQGGVDLALASALAALLPAARADALAARFSDDDVADAALCDLNGWYGVCLLPHEVRSPQRRWLHLIGERDPAQGAAHHAILLALAPDGWARGFADHVAAGPRARLLAALPDLRSRDILTPDHATKLCVLLAPNRNVGDDMHALAAILGDSPGPLSWQVAFELARALTAERFAAAVVAGPPAVAISWTAELERDCRVPWSHELALAHALAGSAEPALAAWAADRARHMSPVALAAAPVAPPVRELDPGELAAIVGADELDLEAALAPARAAPCRGLCAALARRPAPTRPLDAVCAALIGCHDPLPEVARQLDRFGPVVYLGGLDLAVAETWRHNPALPALGHAALFRWERHNFALGDWLDALAGGLLACLHVAESSGGRLARALLWRGCAEVITVWRYRDRGRLPAHVTPEVIDLACDRLTTAVGEAAARILVAAVGEGLAPDLPRLRARALAAATGVDSATRELLSRIVRLDGVPVAARVAHADTGATGELDEISTSDDLDRLAQWCESPRSRVVDAAVARLGELGAAGQRRLAALCADLDRLPAGRPVADSVAGWSDQVAVDLARTAARSAELSPGWRFALCLALASTGTGEWIDRALELAALAWPTRVLERADWEHLVELAGLRRCALELAGSPHPCAYLPAVDSLLDAGATDRHTHQALRRFLSASCERPLELRRAAARALIHRWRDPLGLPITIQEALAPDTDDRSWTMAMVAAAQRAGVVGEIVELAMVAGGAACDESHLIAIIRAAPIDAETRATALVRILGSAMTAAVRRIAATELSADSGAALDAVAPVFAWGVRRGRELTGRMFRIHMTGGERELGHTYMAENRVFVSPLPILRGEPHGRDIVEGLILHELGHHRYHHGPDDAEVWRRARTEGLGPLLNLVADEHLERNLRAIDPDHGDRLKRLAAYAFLHGAQEIAIEHLLGSLGAWAAEALAATPLEVAFRADSVRISRGAILSRLDEAGHPLARFTRALRLGLGDRRADPVVSRALALFGRSFRKLDMLGLYELTRQLADLMGGAIAVAQVFGGPEGITWSERDGDVFGAGLDDDLLQREVDRILDPRTGARGAGRGGKIHRLVINVGPDREFDRITHIVRVVGDRERHRQLASSVHRHSLRLRGLLESLGLRWEPVGARLRGRALDRTRMPALVTRLDPRILVARQAIRRNDLFLGVAIDCSGSMTAGDNITRAQRFGVLIAEAVRDLPGVDARFLGFTDATLYDAGDAATCGVTALRADAGNNDAAALYHLAQLALTSRRKSKVVVMISDGLPTECSVAALRGLVDHLTRRRGIVCAQVAVRPLEEICFPHHVVIDDVGLDVSVARFGRMVADLVQRALSA